MNAEIVAFVAKLNSGEETFGAVRPTNGYGVEFGRRYARVFKLEGSSRSVACFIDVKTGEIFRAKSWKSAGASTGRTISGSKPAAAAPKVIVPTDTNVFAMQQCFGSNEMIPNSVHATDRPHLLRCIQAGLIEVLGASLRVTEAGKEAMAARAARWAVRA